MDALNTGTILGMIGIATSLFTAFYFYRKSLRMRSPYYSIRGSNLIRGSESIVDELEIQFQKKHIKNLTVSKVLFWNDGRETINKDDITTKNHLRIEALDDTKILDAKVLVANNDSNQIKIFFSESGDSVLISFDYLDHKNGAIFQIAHTGISANSIHIVGDIKGVRKIIERTGFTTWGLFISRLIFSLIRSRVGIRLINVIFSITMIAFGIMWLLQRSNVISLPEYLISLENTPFFWLGPVITIGLGLGMLLVSVDIWRTDRFAPAGLESFHE